MKNQIICDPSSLKKNYQENNLNQKYAIVVFFLIFDNFAQHDHFAKFSCFNLSSNIITENLLKSLVVIYTGMIRNFVFNIFNFGIIHSFLTKSPASIVYSESSINFFNQFIMHSLFNNMIFYYIS